ncbi:MAG: DUF4256 domain-containing protein [Planctomycetota bacterium]
MNPRRRTELFEILEARFEKHRQRHAALNWAFVRDRLAARAKAVLALDAMEASGGEPDVIRSDEGSGEIIFCDCAAESPIGRRSLCYDDAALAARKANPPSGSALAMTVAMGIELLDEDQYRYLQTLGQFDRKTSSWVRTPEDVRSRGGALFCDRRYGRVFTYHNGAESYFAARGFRGLIRV